MNDEVKKTFMDAMDEQFVKEFGFDLKTMMLFVDAISKVKTSREKQLETELEQTKKKLEKAYADWRGATGRCSMCKHFRGVPQGCNLPNYKDCTDENDLWEPEPIIYKN